MGQDGIHHAQLTQVTHGEAAPQTAGGSGAHVGEPHGESLGARLNWLRAGVLGANDGIVSVAGIVVGVAAATSDRGTIFTAGLAGLVAGAVSMALGEYVSVSSQRDTELAALAKEKRELHDDAEKELAELAGIYQAKGLSPETALVVAQELTAHDALAAHLDAELGLHAGDLISPRQAAFASACSFLVGAVLPLVAILLAPASWRVGITMVAVLVALTLTAGLSARASGASLPRVLLRVVLGGALGLCVTFGVGRLFGAALS
ncbi:MAG: VIT family protein [Pseudonocardiales bacterium]|nr:VIT family protein [Pseudonocardiales bacterium]